MTKFGSASACAVIVLLFALFVLMLIKKRLYGAFSFFGLFCVTLDRFTKTIAESALGAGRDITLIKNALYFSYAQNTGAAFSFLTGHAALLSVFSGAVIAAGIFFLIRQARKNPNKLFYLFGIVSVLGGAAGNFIDRIAFGYVIDFIDFRLIHFPIFNVADCFITLGAIIFASQLLFDKQIDF